MAKCYCGKYASYGISKRTRCVSHKTDGMVSLAKKRKNFANTCRQKDCDLASSFGYRGQKSLYCKAHKANGMIYLRLPVCQDCDLVACYGKSKAIHCYKHKAKGETRQRDVCLADGCSTMPTFAPIGAKRQKMYCKTHKTDDMISAKLLRKTTSNAVQATVVAIVINTVDAIVMDEVLL
jgi:transposase